MHYFCIIKKPPPETYPGLSTRMYSIPVKSRSLIAFGAIVLATALVLPLFHQVKACLNGVTSQSSSDESLDKSLKAARINPEAMTEARFTKKSRAVTITASEASTPMSLATSVSEMPNPSLWWHDEDAPLRLLLSHWGSSVGMGNVCAQVLSHAISCFSMHDGRQLLELLDRPVMLILSGEKGISGSVLLVALKGDKALVHHKGGQQWVLWNDLALVWRGKFSTFWRISEKWAKSDSTAAREGIVSALKDMGYAAYSANGKRVNFSATVSTFQAAHGLVPSGRVNVRTLMLLNRAKGVNEPRLNQY